MNASRRRVRHASSTCSGTLAIALYRDLLWPCSTVSRGHESLILKLPQQQYRNEAGSNHRRGCATDDELPDARRGPSSQCRMRLQSNWGSIWKAFENSTISAAATRRRCRSTFATSGGDVRLRHAQLPSSGCENPSDRALEASNTVMPICCHSLLLRLLLQTEPRQLQHNLSAQSPFCSDFHTSVLYRTHLYLQIRCSRAKDAHSVRGGAGCLNASARVSGYCAKCARADSLAGLMDAGYDCGCTYAQVHCVE